MSVPDILPPSPPTTNHRDRISSLPITFKPIMSTPDDSPASFPPSSGTGNRKRVEFSPWPNVVDPISSTPASDIAAWKALPPSRDCQTSGKSILKPYTEPIIAVAGFDGSNDDAISPTETLEAIAQQLANNNKGSSVDAYQTLSSLIKGYDEVPEDVNTRSCVATILRCIKRDLSMQDQTQSSPIDTNLMTQALKVAVILVWSEHLSPLLTDEFRVFIIDRSITTLIEHTAPKVIIIHYMHLLAMQSFRPGILSSSNRAMRLLEALQDITNHVQGKGAMSERLLIYQKLIEQARPVMKARANLWIKEVFSGLASSVKDIRDKAISVSTRACAAFPGSPTVSTAAREALASTLTDRAGNTRTISSILTQRLEKMVAAKDEAVQVPQIWALCMLICNSIDAKLESWNLLRDWLKVIQRCFNCSDMSVRSQTFPAWNRFIHISKPHEATDTIVSMLAKPIMSQIERTSTNTTGKGLRPAVVSSYCMLLYHAFRPAASHKQYTRMWNEYIVKLMGSQFLSKSTANADLSARVIMSLMWKNSSTPRVWNENRAHENTYMEPEELPTIDCKWIRAKTEAILQIFRLLFKHSVWGPSVQHSDQAHVAKAWRHFLKALRESASKEIKPSAETRKAVSHIIQFLEEVPSLHSPLSKLDNLEGRSQLACGIAVAELGSLCFVESLETDSQLNAPVLLAELLRVAANKIASTDHETTGSKRQASAQSLPQSLQRCLKLLNHALQKAYNNDRGDLSHLLSIVNIASHTLRVLPVHALLQSLYLIQDGLILVGRDDRNVATTGSETSLLFKPWRELSMTLIDRVIVIPASDYHQIDGLLAALLLSRNKITQNLLIKAWAVTTWTEIDVMYGPQLLEAVAQIQTQTEVNLPGLRSIPMEVESQVAKAVQTGSFLACLDITTTSVTDSNVNDPDNEGSGGEATTVAMEKDTELESEVPATTEQQVMDSVRARYDDSQIQFVPVESSPALIDELESQYLTDRQKEVRERQRADQTVTFPDLRSSPRPRSSRGSRAPSADCEIARKVAAMEDLPSTPTINRQQEGADDDELPSPTPKARHKLLDLRDVEILSSPPSAMGNKKSNVDVQDIPSSPPKAQTDVEVDMVNLADTVVVQPDLVHEFDAVACTAQESHSTTTSNKIDNQVYSSLASAVLGTTQDNNPAQREGSASSREPSPISETEQNAVSDEIDELSASQLSQSLDWHIAEEAKTASSSSGFQKAHPISQRRRKRAVSGYADQDRKKRRRKISSRHDTSMTSAASDNATVLSSELEVTDCIIASTSPPITPSRHHPLRRDSMADSVYRSPISSATRKCHLGYNGSNKIALHVKSPDSDSVANHGFALGSQFKDIERGSTEPLSQSVYESVARGPVPEQVAEEAETFVENVTGSPMQERANRKVVDQVLYKDECLQTYEIDVTTALQMALESLNHVKNGGHANIDLKAIDDLCFKIRYQAQELVHQRSQG